MNYLRMFGLKKGNVYIYVCIGVWGGRGEGGITADSKRLMMNLPCKTRIIPILNNV